MDTRLGTCMQHSINSLSENFANSSGLYFCLEQGGMHVSVAWAHNEIMVLDKAYVRGTIKQVKFSN